jgi:hypothetical protein
MAVVHNSSVVGQKKASKRQEIRRSIRRSENHKNKSEPLSMTRLTPEHDRRARIFRTTLCLSNSQDIVSYSRDSYMATDGHL